MRRCTNCLMAETKPGIELNEDGVCQACYHNERQKRVVDYDARYERLEEIADEHRRTDGSYDCIIPVSGGKDSHYQTYVMKEKLGMNPLLVNVRDPFTKTEAGKHNIKNISRAFDCDLVIYEMSRKTAERMTRIAFEEMGYPDWANERAMQTIPIKVAIRREIPLVVYGENTSWEYGGTLYDHDDEEPYHARNQIDNRVAQSVDEELWTEGGVSPDNLNQVRYPSEEAIEDLGIEPIYLSYFIPWDGRRNYEIAKKWGFQDIRHEWKRDGYIEDYDQVDTIGYLVNVWLKYPKFGFARATDVVGYWRRSENVDLSIEEGVELIREHDHQLDQRTIEDFLEFTGYSHQEFWRIVEEWRNDDLFDEEFTSSRTYQRPDNDFENIDIV